MYDLPQNTIYTYLANPLFDKSDWSKLPVSMLAQSIKSFQGSSKGGKHVHPETDALKFYFLNHGFHTMKSKFHPMEPLDKDMTDVAEKHIKMTNEVAQRLLFYSTIICVEEARFLPKQAESFYEYFDNAFGDDFGKWVRSNFKGNLTDFGKFDDLTMGQYATAMVSVFAFGKWNPGFGGKGWVPIASLVSDAIHGKISLESMADQAFSLCHNNGSMFNKGHMYSCYSSFIYSILDIQDSGQIPQWIGTNLGNKFVDSDLKQVYQVLAKRFPDEMTGPVNQSLISGSEKKRNAKMQQLAKVNQATWNQQANMPKVTPQSVAAAHNNKLNNVLMPGLSKGGSLF